jgi:hypothetical protein
MTTSVEERAVNSNNCGFAVSGIGDMFGDCKTVAWPPETTGAPTTNPKPFERR